MNKYNFSVCKSQFEADIQYLNKAFPALYRNSHKERLYKEALELFKNQSGSAKKV